MNRNVQRRQQQFGSRIRGRAAATEAVDFFNILTGDELLRLTDELSPAHRERLYPPTVTLSMFMRQTLEQDASCQKAVNGWAAQRASDGLPGMSVRTGGYCRARQRLPLKMVKALACETARQLHAKAQPSWRWRGRSVKLVDGTGISMPDTPSNQARFPQPSSQGSGVGFPLVNLVAVICLATGAVLQAGVGPYAGEGTGELALFRELQSTFCRHDVMLADALYCNYWLIATMIAAGVDIVMAQHGCRHTDFRQGKSLGKRDHLVTWSKPASRPAWMTRQQYQAFPDQLTLRESKRQHRVVVTSLLDARSVSQQELSQLYAKRWNVELDLRNIKTTMGMDVLDCQSPEMNIKQLWVHLLAYNVIRLLMAQAACHAGLHPRTLSFKHTVQLWTEWTARALPATAGQNTLFELIAQRSVANRPARLEPRMRKRRPKSYPWLKEPRSVARERVQKLGQAPRSR